MDDLFVLVLHNCLVALVLAAVVCALTSIWRNPPVAHVLWLLVLLKLVAPPVVRVDWPTRLSDGVTAVRRWTIADTVRAESLIRPNPPREDRHSVEAGAAERALRPDSSTTGLDAGVAARLPLLWSQARPVLFWFWIGGAIASVVIAATRILRFERLLAETLPPPERWQRLVADIAAKIGVHRLPKVCYVECVDVPLVWCAGGQPKLVLPIRLFRQLDDRAAALIVAHELAHLRRRDHWVRAVEMIVASIFWWYPLVWMIRRQIHAAEDECCDAWVRWAFPDSAKHYAEVVLHTAEQLNGIRGRTKLLPASPFFHSLSLKARIEMILNGGFSPSLSRKSLLALVLVALTVWPSCVQSSSQEAQAGTDDEAPAKAVAKPEAKEAVKPDEPAKSEFPYTLKFEQGATRFMKGDQITILEVRGTAETLTPGNIYWIKGTYTLASRDRATLLASVTAIDAGQGTGLSFKVQSTHVPRGTGTFALFLPMSYRGWPHVSFYPAEAGECFGGNYFGIGDTVLKSWQVTDDGVRNLQQALPKLKIVR